MRAGQKQSVRALRFFLYDRPIHPELFDIYHDHTIAQPDFDYEAQIWVTGCSHVIGFFRNGCSLLEVTADCDLVLPERGRLLELPFVGEKVYDWKKESGINYMMNFQVESMSPAVYANTHHELARQGARRGLFVPFPMWMSHSLTPFTFIDYDAKRDALHIFAFHAFPEDLTIVKSQSIFELS